MAEEKSSPRINRRDTLKASGSLALAGVGGFSATTPIRALTNEETRLGERRFAEVFLRHEGAPEYPITQTDDLPEYLLKEDSTLVLTRFSRDAALRVFSNNDAVIRSGEYCSPPTVAYGGQYERLPVDGLRDLNLEQAYNFPSVQIEMGTNDSVNIRTEKTETAIASGNTRRITLEERSIKVRQEGQTFKEIPDPKSDKRDVIRTRAKGPTVTETVRPVIVVKNHGSVTVHDNTEVTN